MRSARYESSGALDSVFEPVTGLPDARVFGLLVERKLALARRELQPLSLVAFEIDDYSAMGGSQTRVAMLMTSRIVCSTLRSSDTVCHFGDGVFAAILDNTPDAGAVWAADRVRRNLALRHRVAELTLSMGVAAYPTHALEAGDLSDEAFAALAAARSAGPARIEVAAAARH
ncbi:MAG TPA: hypothetical protein DEP66_05560 [Acidimicrobiaceae bacterium]|nr:hypothetical protein [Acidimicrobiaceae bacterium]